MSGNIFILLFSFLFICIVLYYIYKSWPDLDVIDLYIIFVLCHFGFSPFIRGLYFGRDIIFDFRESSPLIIGSVFVHVLLILIVIKIIYRYLPDTWVEYLKIKNLIEKWSCIDRYILLFIYGTLIIFQIVSYYKFGVKTYIRPDDFARMGKDLPYWFNVIRTIYPLLAFLVCLGLISALLKSQGYHKYIWLVLTIGFLPVITLYGRRFLLSMIIVLAILWLMERRKDIFSVKSLGLCFLLVLSFLLFSNVYQAYRYHFTTVGKVDTAKLKNPYTAVLNFNATLRNFKLRPGTWEFDYLVFYHQYSRPGMFTKGAISWEAIKSSIPRIIWPGKQFVLIDDVLAKLYQVKPPEIDIGKNLFGVLQVEFGFYSLIVVPLIIIFIIIIMATSVRLTMQYPTFLWLFSGNILYFLINIEENGNEIFFMLRNVGLIFVIFSVYQAGQKILARRAGETPESL
jgi:hypothetical protein